MPVLILKDRCDNLSHCYAATACPNQALFYDGEKGQVVVLPERCGDCRGPCLNFCDQFALKYAPTLEELHLLQAELDGSMSAEEIAQERLRLKEAAEARAKQAIPEVTAATFQREVLQASLPVVVAVCTPRSNSCKTLESSLEQIGKQYLGQFLLRRIDSDAEPQLVSALQVRNVPMLLFFYQGQLVHGVAGALSPSQLQSWLQDLLTQVRAVEEDQAKAGRPASGQSDRGPGRPSGLAGFKRKG